jgi:hypothetical protein
MEFYPFAIVRFMAPFVIAAWLVINPMIALVARWLIS